MAAPTNNDAHPRELEARPVRKICIILISLLPALALLSITNVVVAHIFVAAAVLFPPKPKAAAASPKPKEKRKPKQHRVETRMVYVPPTEEDLERIRQELEKSDPLPPIATADDAQRPATRVQSALTSTETLLKQRERELEAAKKDIDELAEAFASFEERLAQDTQSGAPVDGAAVEQLKQRIPSLISVMGRSTFMDLDTDDLMDMLMLAMEETQWLLAIDPKADAQNAALFLNANNSLVETLTNAKMKEADSAATDSCQAYLALDRGTPSIEFAQHQIVTKKSKANANKPGPICKDTARESDLYKLVENIKHILSRRDPASAMPDDGEPIPSPMEEEGVEKVRAQIAELVSTVAEKWEMALAQEEQMRQYWEGRAEALAASSGSGGEGGLCASPSLVEGMVTSGLEAFRRKDDLRSALERSVLESMSEQPEKAKMLIGEIEKVVVPEINYEIGDERVAPSSERSSWKLGKKSVSYLVDGPLVHRGVAGWIDSFVDAISGYNDSVDAMIDWAVGDDGGSVGMSVATYFSKALQKIPFPNTRVEQLKRSGILAGRARVILEK